MWDFPADALRVCPGHRVWWWIIEVSIEEAVGEQCRVSVRVLREKASCDATDKSYALVVLEALPPIGTQPFAQHS